MPFLIMILYTGNIFAREFTYAEKLVVGPLKRTIEVSEYMEKHINSRALALREYLSFKLMKSACTPLTEAVDSIRKAPDVFEDQGAKLSKLYIPCSEAGLGLSHLYIIQK